MPVIGCFVIFLLNSLQALKAWEVAIRKIQAKDIEYITTEVPEEPTQTDSQSP